MRTPFFPITFAGDGTKKSFQLDFNAMDPSDYRVTVDGTLKTLGTDYGIGTPTQDSYYPTVNFTTAPGNGTAIAVTRRTPIRQRKFGVESSRVGDAIQALYRQQERAGSENIRVPYYIDATKLAAHTTVSFVSPVDGYVALLDANNTEAIGTGGTVKVQVAGSDVTGMSVTIANSAAVGKKYQAGPTTAQASYTQVKKGQTVSVVNASFATSGAVAGYVEIQEADLDA